MISIIIPAYKEEKWIADTIRQFDALSIPHEVVVSDGKSLDRTVEIALQYTENVLVYQGARKHNAAIGRNDGAKIATGEYLLFLDSGTMIPEINIFFQRALAHFESDPTLVCLNVFQWISPDETIVDRIMLWITNHVLLFGNNVLRQGGGSGKFMMVQKSAFRQVDGFREDLAVGEDGELVRRLSKIGRTYIDPTLFILYPGRREHTIGWMRLLFFWLYDWFSVALLKRSRVDQWDAVR